MKVSDNEIRERLEELRRVELRLDEQIADGRGVLRCLDEEERLAGSLSAVRRAEDIVEESEQLRVWLYTVTVHRDKVIKRRAALERALALRAAARAKAKREARQAAIVGGAGK